jgi:hypothetical protein
MTIWPTRLVAAQDTEHEPSSNEKTDAKIHGARRKSARCGPVGTISLWKNRRNAHDSVALNVTRHEPAEASIQRVLETWCRRRTRRV